MGLDNFEFEIRISPGGCFRKQGEEVVKRLAEEGPGSSRLVVWRGYEPAGPGRWSVRSWALLSNPLSLAAA